MQAGSSFHQLTIGLCEDYPEESRSIAAARNDLLLLQTNHIAVLRIAFGWDAMEPERGKYDWSFWDEYVGSAKDLGVTLIPYICYTPKWASSDQGTNYWRAPPKDPKDFQNFVSQLVRRYKGSIHSWELWNEPDNAAYWSGSVEQLAALIKAGSQAVRAADPQAKVVCGGMAWNLDVLRQLFEEHGVNRYVDVVNVHNYNETWSGDPLERIFDIASEAKKIVREHGNDQPVWFAEVGYSDFRKGDYVSDIYHAQFAFEHTPQFQAVSVGRAITVAAANGNVSTVAWYRIHDLPATQEVIGDVNNRHLGVLATNNQPKQALAALTFFNSLFSQPVRCLDNKVTVSRHIQSAVETHVFERQAGDLFVVAWLRVIRHGELSARGATRESFDLQFPFALTRPAEVYNERGQRLGQMKMGERNGHAALENIPVNDGTLVVIRLEASIQPRRTGASIGAPGRKR